VDGFLRSKGIRFLEAAKVAWPPTSVGQDARALLTRLRAAGEIEWSRAVVDSSHLQAKKEGSETGPSPVDRGRAQATSTSHVRSSTRRVRGKPAG
jgi:hypothetical protein